MPQGRRNNMPVSKKQQACVTRYVKQHYDRISVTVPQGKRDLIKDYAAAVGESVNGYINKAVDERMERETADE
ncbi:MAG: ABC transporter ATP-binding protein [Oscillospiraceae bacterium]|nr:ABC transporter ATP-binding protein [Oscillospiraceae bacterium]